MNVPKLNTCSTLLLFLTIYCNGYAQLTLNETVNAALCNNPQLKAAKSDVAIAQARLIDAGKLENPVFAFALQSQVEDGPDREGSIFLGYSQKFPVTGKLLFQRDLGIANVHLAYAEVKEVEREFIARVQKAYIEAAGAHELIRVLQKAQGEADAYSTLSRQKLELAQGSKLDVSAAETEKLLLIEARLQAEGALREHLAELKPFLGKCQPDHLSLNQSLAGIIGAIESTVQYHVPDNLCRADITAARLRCERACANEKLARAESLEDWEIEAGYEAARSVDEPIGAERERFLGLGVKIPLPVRKKGEGKIAEACAEAKKYTHEYEALKLVAAGEIESAIKAVQASRQRLATLENKILPQFRNRESETRDAYDQGLVDFSQVILLRQQQNRTLRTTVEVKLEMALALARLQYSLGSHPCNKTYCPGDCPVYKPGTEPEDAPFSVPVLARPIQAYPVSTRQPETRKVNRRSFNKRPRR